MTGQEFRTLRLYFYRVFTKLALTGKETRIQRPKFPELEGLVYGSREYNRKYYELTKEEQSRRKKEYRRKNLEEVRSWHRRSYKKHRAKRLVSMKNSQFKQRYGDFAEVAKLTNELKKEIFYGKKSSIKKVS